MNIYETAIIRFVNDLLTGGLVPKDQIIFDEIKFACNIDQYLSDLDILSKLEYMLRNGKACIVVKNG